jgi:Acetyltransferase (GNAT) domain
LPHLSEPAINQILSTSMRSRLRNKERKLQRVPGYRYVHARDDAEIDRLLNSFFSLTVLVTALLSVGEVSQLFSERAALEQDYDTGRFGRFGRYGLGADIALEHPLGIGPLQFWLLFVEDPHNSFLNAFLSGGWLAGFCYLALAVVTVVMSTRFLFVRTPWQPIYHAIYAAYVGTIAESAIIDIDHWRHYFLILGLLWGLMAASRQYVAAAPSATSLQPATA